MLKLAFILPSPLIQQRPSVHAKHLGEDVLYATAPSLWGHGAAPTYLENQWQSQEQNCGPKEPETTHFKPRSLPALFLSVISLWAHLLGQLEPLAGKGYYLPRLVCFSFLHYKGLPNLPAGLLVRLLPNPCLSKPSKSAKVATAEQPQKQIWPPGEGAHIAGGKAGCKIF